GEVRISVKVACTACWTAWAVASLTAAATDSLRASDRPSRIESNLSSWALNVLRVWPFVVGFMVILRVLLMTGEVARPDVQPRGERSDSDRLTAQGRPERAGSFSFPGASVASQGGLMEERRGKAGRSQLEASPAARARGPPIRPDRVRAVPAAAPRAPATGPIVRYARIAAAPTPRAVATRRRDSCRRSHHASRCSAGGSTDHHAGRRARPDDRGGTGSPEGPEPGSASFRQAP